MKILLVAVNAIYTFKSGRLQPESQLRPLRISGEADGVFDQSVSGGNPSGNLQRKGGRCLFFLLYMEYSDHRTGCPVAEDGVAGNPDMAWRSGSIL